MRDSLSVTVWLNNPSKTGCKTNLIGCSVQIANLLTHSRLGRLANSHNVLLLLATFVASDFTIHPAKCK